MFAALSEQVLFYKFNITEEKEKKSMFIISKEFIILIDYLII